MNPRPQYLIGVSGGRDSVVLLHAMLAAGHAQLAVCHLNHGLRGKTSDRDADFVRKLAAAHSQPFLSAKADVKSFARASGQSIETAARTLRYAFFTECARRTGCRRLVLAHHADDQIETVLFNFLRGSGAAGLAGMRPKSKRGTLTIFRPLLALRGETLAGYAAENSLKWREDTSNQSREFTRNRLRLELIPQIEQIAGRNFREAILRAAEIFAAEAEWMATLTPTPTRQLSVADLARQPLAQQRRTLREWLKLHQVTDPGFAEVERVRSLLDLKSGPAKVNLPGDRHARRRAGKLFIE